MSGLKDSSNEWNRIGTESVIDLISFFNLFSKKNWAKPNEKLPL